MPKLQAQPADKPTWRLAWLLALPLLFVLAACQRPPADTQARREKVLELYANFQRQMPDVPDIAPAQALALWKDDKTVFVDARTEAERAVSTQPGAVSEATFLADPGRYDGKKIIVYCTVGYRSGLFTGDLAKRGVAAVNLAGGILGWLHAGGPIMDSKGQPTKRVHVYGRTWDLAPTDYTAVW